MQPIIVIGPPRSGTSVIARLLQESLGVMMDEGPIRKDILNPNGFYEDHRLVKINQLALKAWKIGQENKMNMEWATQFAQWLAYRMNTYERWGFKEPRCVGFLSWVKQFVPDAIWLVCQRNHKQIIKSQVETLGYTKEVSRLSVPAYYEIINKNLRHYHAVNLKKLRSEKNLTMQLQGFVNG